MRLGKKLLIYSDGSYVDGKGGWAFHISCNKNYSPWFLGFGSYGLVGSAQTEIIACVEALNYLLGVEYKQLRDIEIIEIRSDFLLLVNFINNYSKSTINKHLHTNNYPAYFCELQELIKTIKKLQVQIRAKKVSKKDLMLLKVHQKAKYSLNELPVDANYLYIEKNENEYVQNESDRLKENKVIDKLISVRNNSAQYIHLDGINKKWCVVLKYNTIPTNVENTHDVSNKEFVLDYVI